MSVAEREHSRRSCGKIGINTPGARITLPFDPEEIENAPPINESAPFQAFRTCACGAWKPCAAEPPSRFAQASTMRPTLRQAPGLIATNAKPPSRLMTRRT